MRTATLFTTYEDNNNTENKIEFDTNEKNLVKLAILETARSIKRHNNLPQIEAEKLFEIAMNL